VDHPLIGEAGHCRSEGQDPRVRLVGVPARLHGLGVGVDVPRPPTSVAEETARAFASRRRRIGDVNQPAQLAAVLQKLETIRKEFNASQSGGKKVSLARPDRPRRRRRDRESRQGGRARREGPLHRRGAWTRRRSRPTRPPSPRWSRSPTVSGNYLRGKRLMSPEEALVDRAQLLTLTAPEMTVLGRRPARPGRKCRGLQARRLHQTARDADE